GHRPVPDRARRGSGLLRAASHIRRRSEMVACRTAAAARMERRTHLRSSTHPANRARPTACARSTCFHGSLLRGGRGAPPPVAPRPRSPTRLPSSSGRSELSCLAPSLILAGDAGVGDGRYRFLTEL